MISEQASFINPGDMVIVMVVALIVFGPKKLPEVGRQLGQAIRELKKLTGELTDSIQSESEGIKSAFENVSPYTLKSTTEVSEVKLPTYDQGYSKADAMSESPLVAAHGEEPKLADASTVSAGQAEAALVPLSPVVPKSGDNIQ